MRFTIKEIKERAETEDKVNFKGIVDKVWDFNEKATKYSIGYQNIIVKDETDKIKVIFSKIKKKEDIYEKDIEGKKVEVSGKVSIYKDEVNIFGELSFEEEADKQKDQTVAKTGVVTSMGELRIAKQPGLTGEEIRLKCLFLANGLLRMENITAKEVIQEAKLFEGYVCKISVAIETKTKESKENQKSETKKEKPKSENGDGEKLTQEHIKQINILMALAENRGEEGKEYLNDLIVIKGYKTIKEFEKEDIEEATKKLENMGTEEIPF